MFNTCTVTGNTKFTCTYSNQKIQKIPTFILKTFVTLSLIRHQSSITCVSHFSTQQVLNTIFRKLFETALNLNCKWISHIGVPILKVPHLNIPL